MTVYFPITVPSSNPARVQVWKETQLSWLKNRRRKKNAVLVAEWRRVTRLNKAMMQAQAEAAHQRFPNAAYQKGWMDALKFLNIPVQEDRGSPARNTPATKARQSRITHRSDRPDKTNDPAP